MSTLAVQPIAARPAVNPWVLAAAVVVPTFMEVLDTTVANVALRYIAGGLSAAASDAEWVITSYLAANAIILPMSGWISAHIGRRNYFLLSIAVFTLASALCGFATSLEQLIAFRILQGLAGGGLQPSSQGILLDRFPPERQGAAQTFFGVAALIAPIVGPTLGGYLTDNYNWRWIFYINIPVGAVAFAACYLLLEDPDYLKKQKAELRSKPLNFDYIGLGLLTLALSSWEILLSKGQEWDWLGDPFGRVQLLVALVLLGGAALVWHELRIKSPVVNFRPLAERNFAISSIIIFCAFAVLYGASTSTPGLLQSLLGYDAYHSGLVLSPGGISSIAMMVVVGVLLGRGFDARGMLAIGLLTVAASNWWMAHMNLDIDPWHVIGPRMMLTAGLGLIFVPISVAAYKYIPLELRGAAVGLFSLFRNEGGSVGTSMAKTILERRDQFHVLRLNEHLDPLNPAVQSFAGQGRDLFLQHSGDPVGAQAAALQALSNVRDQQALSLSYFDVFWVGAVLPVVLVALIFFMKRSVAEKGEHAAAE